MAASVPDAKAQQRLLSQCPSLPQQLGPSNAGTRWVGPGQSRCPPGTRALGSPARSLWLLASQFVATPLQPLPLGSRGPPEPLCWVTAIVVGPP